MCKHPAKQGGLSRFCKNTVRGDDNIQQLRRLYQPVYFDRQAEHAIGEAKTSFAPMFSGKIAL